MGAPGPGCQGPVRYRRAMCGRYVSVSSPTILAERFHVDEVRTDGDRARTTTSRPGPRCRVVAESQGERVLDLVRWGLVPSWAKDLSIGDRHDQRPGRDGHDEQRVQAGVRAAPVHRPGRRLLRVAEDRRHASSKQPWFIRRRDGEPLAFAGLWEIWHDPNDRRRRAARPDVHDHHDRAERAAASRFTTACRSCCPESEWDTWLDRREPRRRRAAASCSCPRRPTSSRRGRSRRS